jgi:Flp pilus assembly protein TadD
MGDHLVTTRSVSVRLGLAALLCSALLAGLLSLFPVTSFDVWWHLRTGELIVDQASVPTTDPYSFTAAGRPWVTHEWLFEVLLFGLYRLGGVNLLIVVKALLAAAAIALGAVAGMVGRDPAEHLPAAALGALLAGPLIAARAFIRPHMATALLLGVTLLLLRLESSTGRRRYRWALVPTFLLWSNLHSGFVLGLALVVLYWAGEAVTRTAGRSRNGGRTWLGRGVTLAAAAAATLVNPNGVEAFLYPLRLVSRAEVRASIVELRSIFHPAYRGALFLDALAVTGIVVAVLLVSSRRRLVWNLLLPAVAFTGLALASLRGVSELAVLVPAVIAAHGTVLGTSRHRAQVAAAAVLVAAAVCGVAAAAWGQPMGQEPNRRCGLGIYRPNWPAAAARFLDSTQPAGQTFNPLAFGGAFIFELWPRRQVFIDGRLDVYPADLLAAYVRLVDTGEGWDDMVSRYGLGSAVVSYSETPGVDSGLRARLREDSHWVCVFFSDNALVYARRTPANAALIERYGTPFNPSLRSRGSVESFVSQASAGEVAQAIRAIGAMAGLAADESAPNLVLGMLLLRTGRPVEAVDPLREAVAAAPASRDARGVLVEALVAVGRSSEARTEAASSARLSPTSAEPLLALADLEHSSGRLDEAAAALEEAIAVDPTSVVAHVRLGVVAAERGRYDEAKRHFEDALRLRPDDPSAIRNMETLRTLRTRTPRADGSPD